MCLAALPTLPGRTEDPNPIHITSLLLHHLIPLIKSGVPPWDQVELAFRTIQGGILPNQTDGNVEVVSTFRSTLDEGRTQALDVIKEVAVSLEAEQGVEIQIAIQPEVRPLLVNTPHTLVTFGIQLCLLMELPL